MVITVGVSVWQLLVHCLNTSEFKAPRHARLFPSEALFAVSDYELRSRLWHVNHHELLGCQVTVSVGVSIGIRTTVRQVGDQVALVVIGAKSALFLLHGVHLITK